MEFSFKEETEKLMLASENINEIIDRYNEILTGLSDN